MSRSELEAHLAWHSDTYTAETLNNIVTCVLSMSKPLAEILDDLRIPRETVVVKFVELEGPPKPPAVSDLILRRIEPSAMKLPDVHAVQPLSDPVSLIMLMPLSFSTKELHSTA
ncbi:hypothetical protein [Ralstonia phage RP31]|nr:hypothetical protein [Ralstonia phage RP31]